MNKIKPFTEPIYVTRPLLPDLKGLSEKLEGIWASGWLTNNGPKHALLEKKLSDLLKVPHLSLFNNGTIALMTACRALGLNGKVITTPFTFPATPLALTWNNIEPVFCDIDPDTMNIDADKIASLITSGTTGILAVHVFGSPCDVVKIREIGDRYGLRVIYDAAHAFGVEINGKGIGTFGDISMFSFHATKLFHTAEGGALSFTDNGLKESADMLKNFGMVSRYDSVMDVILPGTNGKMNELQAVLGLAVLNCLEEEKRKRESLFKKYHDCLNGIEGLSFMAAESAGIKKNYQYFVVRIDEKLFGASRDRVYHEFQKYNVFARRYFYPLCSNYTCYSHLPSSDPTRLPVANKVAQEVLALPFYGDLAAEDVERICDILRIFRIQGAWTCRE